MTAPYKKRAQAGWNTGKGCKEEANRAERGYDEVELKEQQECLNERHIKASSKQKKTSQDKEILNLCRDVSYAIKISRGDIDSLKWGTHRLGHWSRRIYQNYEQAIPKLQELLLSDLKPKMRRLVKTTLDQCIRDKNE